jgi:hypothetical protein
MSARERWAKRVAKGFLWAPAYFIGAWWLNIDPNWRVLLLVVVCGIWSNVLDALLPTDSAFRPIERRA